MRLFGLAAIVLFILGLICSASSSTLAGAAWPVWDSAGALAAALELFAGGIIARVQQ